MRGKHVFYPMGWDDNGLPTERRVQNYYGVRCDPSLPYDPSFTPPEKPGKDQMPGLAAQLRRAVHAADRGGRGTPSSSCGAASGCRWTGRTSTGRSRESSRATAQRMFLHNLARGEAYAQEAPTLWDVTFRTAVAQAELEDRERPGAYHRIALLQPRRAPVYIETTRPELLPACVALVAHPDDERYQPLFGKTVRTPLFGVEVPVRGPPPRRAGQGLGHRDDLHLRRPQRRHLVARAAAADPRDRRLGRPDPAPTRRPGGAGARPYDELAGKTVFSAQQRIVELLRESGDLDGEPRPITHPVKFFEKGERPLEIVTTRQWYIRNGGRDAELRDALVARGREIQWVPEHMRHRYENWVEGLNGDWLISRQRFFGVPFPVWYRLDDRGRARSTTTRSWRPRRRCRSTRRPTCRRASPRTSAASRAASWPTPTSWTPGRRRRCRRRSPRGWDTDPELFAHVFPMDLRPQAHDIIRTWLFSTVVRSHFEHGAVPWSHATISGFVVDPDRKKMSKSKGNATTPIDVLERYGTDAVRWRAAGARPGADSPFDEAQMKVGRRLAIKILNVGKFVLGLGAVRRPVGRRRSPSRSTAALLAALADGRRRGDRRDGGVQLHPRARGRRVVLLVVLRRLRRAGEVAGLRATDAAAESAQATLALALSVQLRLFAPVLPFVTEEVWSWWQDGSVHRAPWPAAAELPAGRRPGGRRPRRPRRWPGCARRSPTPSSRCGPTSQTATVTAPAEQVALVEAARGRPRRRRADRRRCRSCRRGPADGRRRPRRRSPEGLSAGRRQPAVAGAVSADRS